MASAKDKRRRKAAELHKKVVAKIATDIQQAAQKLRKDWEPDTKLCERLAGMLVREDRRKSRAVCRKLARLSAIGLAKQKFPKRSEIAKLVEKINDAKDLRLNMLYELAALVSRSNRVLLRARDKSGMYAQASERARARVRSMKGGSSE